MLSLPLGLSWVTNCLGLAAANTAGKLWKSRRRGWKILFSVKCSHSSNVNLMVLLACDVV